MHQRAIQDPHIYNSRTLEAGRGVVGGRGERERESNRDVVIPMA